MDVNEGPLIRAEEHVREAGLKEQIKMRRSNGLENCLREKWKPSLSRVWAADL